MSVKNKQIQFKSALTKVEDVDEKGIVRFYASVFGNKDRAGDVVVKGAYAKTLAENFKEIQHFKNHDSRMMPGVVTEAKEDDKGLLITSSLIMGTQLGRETYEEYKAMAAAGKSMFHSIGYYPVKEDEDRENSVNYLKEIYLREVSTLTAHPANPLATTVDVKSEISYLDELLKSDLSDMKLEEIEKMKNTIIALYDKKAALLKALEDQKEPQITAQELINIFKF
jgi:hypothetical protein